METTSKKIKGTGTYPRKRSDGGCAYQAKIYGKEFESRVETFDTKAEAEKYLKDEVGRQRAAKAAKEASPETLPPSGDWRDLSVVKILEKFSKSNHALDRHKGHFETTKRLAEAATVNDLMPSWITAYIKRARTPAKPGKRPYAWNTIRIHFSLINSAIKWQAKMLNQVAPSFVVEKDYFEAAGRDEGLDLARGKWRNPRKRRLEEGEEELMREQLARVTTPDGPHLRLFFDFSLATCFRLKEAALCRWEHISPQVRSIAVPAYKSQERLWTVDPQTREALEALHALRSPDPLLFHTLEHKKLSKRLNKLIKDAGLKDFRWHDLRHEAITRYVATSDAKMELIMQSVGHTSPEMTRKYTHLREIELERMMLRRNGGGLGSGSARVETSQQSAQALMTQMQEQMAQMAQLLRTQDVGAPARQAASGEAGLPSAPGFADDLSAGGKGSLGLAAGTAALPELAPPRDAPCLTPAPALRSGQRGA
jgi:integrase